MKRKFKLITSVASLCLAIALMVGGVFAATNPTVAINGSVSFTATKHVYATVSLKEEGDADFGGAQSTDAATAQGTELAFSLDSANLAMEAGDLTYQYEVKIVNNSVVADLYVTPNALPTAGEYASFVTVECFEDGEKISTPAEAAITKGGSNAKVYKVVVTIAENANSVDIAALNISWGFGLSATAA